VASRVPGSDGRRAGRPRPRPSRGAGGPGIGKAAASGRRRGDEEDHAPWDRGRIRRLSAIAARAGDTIAMIPRGSGRRAGAGSIRAEVLQRREVESRRIRGGGVTRDGRPAARDRKQKEADRDMGDPCREAEPPLASAPHSPFLASRPRRGRVDLGKVMGDPMFQKSFASQRRRKRPACCRFATGMLRV
jgi:hypothetical protein